MAHGNSEPSTNPQMIARLKPGIRGYPSIDANRWYPVLRTEDLGFFIPLPGKERFVFWQDFDVKENP
jgi:hypothetical protein